MLKTATRPRARKRLELQPLVARWKWAAFPIVLFLCTRIALLGFSQIAMIVEPTLRYGYSPQKLLQHYPALDGLSRWDSQHFLRIAYEGYTEPLWTNFFPLCPLLVRTLHVLTGIPAHLGLLIVPNVAGLGAFLVIYRIFIMLADEDGARWALVLFAAYPFAFFQATAYPESLMIFSSSLAVLLALRGNHIWAGVALGFGVLARHLTLFTGAALLAAQIRQRGLHPRRLLLNPAILGLLIPWLFLGLYCLYQYITFGNPLAFAAARAMPPWGDRAWWGIGNLLTTTEQSEHVPIIYSYLPFAAITTIGAIALVTRQEWTELAAFAVVFILVLWGIGMWGLGRYTASCWPAFLPLGIWLAKRPNWQGPVIGMLALFQGLYFYLFIHMIPIL